MSETNYKIVVIDDDKDLLDVIAFNLEDKFKVTGFTDPNQAMSYLDENSIDAVVLDYHIGKTRAPEVYEELRSRKHDLPVLFLTGDHDLRVKLESLDLGAADVLHKPISSVELTAHLNNRIRTHKKNKPSVIKIKNLEVNLQDPRVLLDGNTVAFTPKEFKILCALVTRPNEVVTKSYLMTKLWQDVKVCENNLDTHLSSIRKKLVGFNCSILTIKCVGYVLRV